MLWNIFFFIKKDLNDILPSLVRLQLKIKVLQYLTANFSFKMYIFFKIDF